MKYSEDLQMQIAFEHYVDCESIAKLGDRYEIPSDTVYRFCREHRGEFRDAIVRNWKRSEKRMRRAVADYRNGETVDFIRCKYHIGTTSLYRALSAKSASYLTTPPVFTEEELTKAKAVSYFGDWKTEILSMDAQKKPLYGIYNPGNGTWLQRLCHGGIMRPWLYSTMYGANAKLAQVKKLRGLHNIGAAELKVQWYGWKQ